MIGWREWLDLPALGIAEIKAKIDTGARTSALHAFHVKSFKKDGKEMIRFQVHPYQKDSHNTVTAEAELLEWRHVTNSGGHQQLRPVILTPVELAGQLWNIELTLTNRDVMGFRMLLGREAVRQRFLVDPGGSFLLSEAKTTKSRKQPHP
ncbi:ATP-dependent zinc protease [Crocosphaera sp. XPORK-15E]|uniref:ATP-dependent zinc protease family protein n=1 Tax=Crocosphaera sp. XPORK-15E TaxID=3110247 RepID=UPI002B207E8E|nr:RimK/LysX family protein [Crocosphaera sp. XPORK-15E]MEA5537400.1 RimK/LysX family protein [Crocosphaera sp. XPORK-15E]